MGEISVDGKNGASVKSAAEMAGRFYAELITDLPDWERRLAESPGELEQLERDVHAVFARGADLLVVGLIALVMKRREFESAAKQSRKDYRFPLRRGTNRQIRVRLLGGLVAWVTSLYCAPKRKLFGEAVPADAPGLYLELNQFGFGKGCSPGLQSRVSRQAAICPSLQLATQELQRDGVQLNVKAVRRIAQQCGEGLLALRKHEIELWREGKLPAGTELHEKRVTVQIDGGRTKIRGALCKSAQPVRETNEDGLPTEDAPGRSKRKPKRTFAADWREPKLVTIFVHDECGRMAKNSQVTIDGTFEGPDAIAEMVAMHLHRLGAAKAKSVTFAADGATWIWDRVPTIVQQAKLDGVLIYEVLDCCHATHHISLALAAQGLNSEERVSLYRMYRTMLRNGQWQEIVANFKEIAADASHKNEALETEIAYLEKHGKAGRLKYPYFRSQGIPIGSGAIESSIRRVINLRLKGNGVFWKQEAAEAMLQIRSLVIANRWDDRIQTMRKHSAYDGSTNWKWNPRPMSCKAEDNLQTST